VTASYRTRVQRKHCLKLFFSFLEAAVAEMWKNEMSHIGRNEVSPFLLSIRRKNCKTAKTARLQKLPLASFKGKMRKHKKYRTVGSRRQRDVDERYYHLCENRSFAAAKRTWWWKCDEGGTHAWEYRANI